MSNHEWQRFFPFAKPRVEQAQAIEQTLDALTVDNKKFVIVECGTGLGKSAIALTVSRCLIHKSGVLPENMQEGTYFLTTQKLLQEQYVNDFGKGHRPISSIKSASNYTCQMHENSDQPISCAEVHRLIAANEVFKELYKTCNHGECCYKSAKQRFLNSLEGVTNYSYFLAETKYAGKLKPRRLLVLDESHTLEESLSKFVEISVSEKFATQQLDVTMPASFKDLRDALNWLKGPYMLGLKNKIIELSSLVKNVSEIAKKIKSFQSYARQCELLDKHKCKLNRFFASFEEKNWVLNIVPATSTTMRKLEFKPIDVSQYAKEHLFDFADKVILMSATILDKNVFCRSLGLNAADVAHVKFPSPFKLENKPVHFMPIGSMSKKNIDDTLPRLSKAVQILLDNHPKEKGVIHAVNYRIAQFIHENVKSPRLLIHDALNREEVLKFHKKTNKPTVIISPSMTEGVDLSDDFSRFQVLCKVPFPYLGDKVIVKRMERDEKWYDYQTVKTIVQALGRSIRNENDYAVSYILDSDWRFFFKRTQHMFPEELLLQLCQTT